MGSVAINPGVSSLIETLSNSGSPGLSAALSSPTVQSAIANAAPGDLAQLSDQALQLQEASALFGTATQTTSTANPSDLLQSLGASLLASLTATPASTSSNSTADAASTDTASVANQLAAYQSVLQAEQVQAMFAADPTASTTSSVNVLA